MQWHPTPVLLPGESHGWRSLVGCSPWGRKESDTTEQLHFHFSLSCIGKASQIAKFLLWFACLFLPSFFLFFILFLIGGKLLYNIVLVSAIHQHESATGYTYVPSLLNLPRTSDPTVPLSGCHRTPGLNSLHHTANSHWLAVLNMVMYMFQCHSFNLSHPLLPTLGPQCFANIALLKN